MDPQVDPQGWLDDFQRHVADLQQKSTELQERLAEASGTASSPDGSVTVTIGPSGALDNLALTERAMTRRPAELAQLIMSTAARAQQQASQLVVEALQPMAAGTQVMDVVNQFLPPPVPDEEPVDAEPAPDALNEDEQNERTGPPSPQAPPRPAKPAKRNYEEDDEEPLW
ncbi:YbaB/EbfC family nucleoid-associated protein [Solihabitans fulvus]|uniref:YbaB/EbfC family nucleoid-associated protein n=1 Tax=Solihabitans fulvus TaxID=1892852 RepID=A0A5B2XNM6_9PSEU|nr:YbaB/EbfC family nucleoid-associated protein [Solihabitans fulvus]KAA2264580.1 YbaB/EbfC family nucleoid-associated protein [Solihabitans fulvus]